MYKFHVHAYTYHTSKSNVNEACSVSENRPIFIALVIRDALIAMRFCVEGTLLTETGILDHCNLERGEEKK